MEKLGKQQTKDRIADMLRREILSGRIRDGEKLAQEQLAEILQVSRMPVREALQILELEGFLVRLPNRHMQVVGISASTIYDSMRVVSSVEVELALMLLERNLAPPASELPENSRFHNWFSDQLDNHYLNQMHKRLLAGYPKYVWESIEGAVGLTAHHGDIADAFRRGDIGAVRATIHRYYHALADMLLTQLEESRT